MLVVPQFLKDGIEGGPVGLPVVVLGVGDSGVLVEDGEHSVACEHPDEVGLQV